MKVTFRGFLCFHWTPKKEYSENRKKKGGMTRKARCLCEKDFLEKSLSPTKCCSLKYSELRLRQAMAPADRQKGRPISYPEWSALVVPSLGWAEYCLLTLSQAWERVMAWPGHCHDLLSLNISHFPCISWRTAQKSYFSSERTAGMEEKCLCMWIYDPGGCKPAGPQPCKWSKRTVGHTE